MRTTALLVLVFCLAAGLPQARAGEAETIAAVNAAAAALDDAFERQSADEISHMMTADHIAVSSYYGAPQTVAEQIASLPELKYEQTIIGAVKVDVLGPDAAMRTFTARLDGTYLGKPYRPLSSSPPSWCGRTASGSRDFTRSPRYSLSPLSRDQWMR